MIGRSAQQLMDVLELVVGESEGAVDGGILGGGHGSNLVARPGPDGEPVGARSSGRGGPLFEELAVALGQALLQDGTHQLADAFELDF